MPKISPVSHLPLRGNTPLMFLLRDWVPPCPHLPKPALGVRCTGYQGNVVMIRAPGGHIKQTVEEEEEEERMSIYQWCLKKKY